MEYLTPEFRLAAFLRTILLPNERVEVEALPMKGAEIFRHQGDGLVGMVHMGFCRRCGTNEDKGGVATRKRWRLDHRQGDVTIYEKDLKVLARQHKAFFPNLKDQEFAALVAHFDSYVVTAS